jgi:TRAP-type C4-dicarboxylate transport system substrate-binding protein
MTITRRQFIAATCVGATAAMTVRPAFAGVQLNLADVLPDGNFMVLNAKKYADGVAKATAGEVVINIRAGGSLGFKGPEQMRAVRDGLVPMADILTTQQIGDEAMFGTEAIPFLVGSQAELRSLHKFLRPEFDKLAAKFNQKILYMVPSPQQYMFLKIKTGSADGLKGIKIRGADKLVVDTTTAVGMAGVIIPWGELIPALASGRVDGVATSATSGVDGKFWEFLKYIYPTNHLVSSNMVNINLDTWKKIPASQQKAMEELATKLEPEFWEVSAQADRDALKKLTDNGMEVVQMPPAMMSDIRKRAAPLLDEYLKRVPAAGPIVKQYLASVGRA